MSNVATTNRFIDTDSYIPKSRHTISDRAKSPHTIYTTRELACNLRDAIVTISVHFILKDKNNTERLMIRRGNGFFIKGHYIICPSFLVLINPTFNYILDSTHVFVDVSNVNGSGRSYSYTATIIGIDGAANICILNIVNIEDQAIRTCHPLLQWGKSRSTCPGDTIIVIGNISAPILFGGNPNIVPGTENAISVGTLSDNRYVFPTGAIPGELLLLSPLIPIGSQGLPIITLNGTVIGMSISPKSSFSYNIALSEFFMRRPVKALIRSYQDQLISERYQKFIEPFHTYYRFNKGYLGIAGILMGQDDYYTNISFNPISRIKLNQSVKIFSKEIIGYRILSVSSFPPDPLSLFIHSPHTSPLFNIVKSGDIITHLNDCPLGDRKGQISPSLIMWRVCPGDSVSIRFKKQSENFQYEHDVNVITLSYHPFSDYPFYCDNEIPYENMLPTLI